MENKSETAFNDIINKYIRFVENATKPQKWSDKILNYQEKNIEAVTSHNQQFSKILELYCENLNNSFLQKRLFKNSFFYMCCGVLVAIAIASVIVIGIVVYMTFKYQHLKFDVNGIYTILGGTLGAFLTSFIVLPYIISRYLFNTYEETNLMQIVKLIKEHDIKIRESIESNTYDFDNPKVYTTNKKTPIDLTRSGTSKKDNC